MGKDLKNLNIAVLSPEKNEMISCDLYLNISQDISISCTGKNEVHLSGYFEPNSGMDEQMFGDGLGMEDEEDDEDELSEDELEALKADAKQPGKKDNNGSIDKSLKQAKKNAIKNTIPDDDSSDDDDEDESDDEN